DSDAGHGSLVACEECERNAQDGHDEREKRNGELLVVLNAKRSRLEAARLQLADVVPEFLEVHLLVLFLFLREPGGRLGQLRKRCTVAEELTVVVERTTCLFTHSVLKGPGSRLPIPVRAFCGNLIDELKVTRVQLVHIDTGHDGALRI